MKNKVRIPRLEHFVEVMKAVPKKKFNIDNWREDNHYNEPLKVTIPDTFVKLDCRSVACALGWAALDKKFRRQGLKWVNKYNMSEGKSTLQLVYKDVTYEKAGGEFFGLDSLETNDLFFPDSYSEIYVEPKHVVKKIKALIKRYKKAGDE